MTGCWIVSVVDCLSDRLTDRVTLQHCHTTYSAPKCAASDWAMLHCVMLCCAAMCHAVLCCNVSCCAVLQCVMLCCAALCHAVLRCNVSCCAALHCVMLCCAALCHAVLRCTMSCCAVLYCAVSRFAMTLVSMTAGRPPWFDACGEGQLPFTAAECAALEQCFEAGMCSVQQPQHG